MTLLHSQALKEQFIREGFKLKKNAIRKFTIGSEQGAVKGEIENKEDLQKDWVVDLEFGDRDGTQVSLMECCNMPIKV